MLFDIQRTRKSTHEVSGGRYLVSALGLHVSGRRSWGFGFWPVRRKTLNWLSDDPLSEDAFALLG